MPSGEFVRRFFGFLEREGISAAALHGWQDGFEGELSDVDFVMEPSGFRKIAELVHAHCQNEGWCLCQILRHETTAAYCICVSRSDPSRIVALDACSDFQRNGMFFLNAGEMLDGATAMPWGGAHVHQVNHLLYRVLKAAGKAKNVEDAAVEFAEFPASIRTQVAAIIRGKWKISLDSWDAETLGVVFPRLARACFSWKAFLGPKATARAFARLLQPTGMIMLVDDDLSVAPLRESLSPLFRKCGVYDHIQYSILWDIVKSGGCILRGKPGGRARRAPRDWRLDFRGIRDISVITHEVVESLHARIVRWHGLRDSRETN